MAAVAKRLVFGVFAGAEINRPIPLSDILQRFKPGALMRPVAKRLRLALATSAPPIFAALFDVYLAGLFLRYYRLGHDNPFPTGHRTWRRGNSSGGGAVSQDREIRRDKVRKRG